MFYLLSVETLHDVLFYHICFFFYIWGSILRRGSQHRSCACCCFRYRIEYEALSKVEAEQNEFIDQFILQKWAQRKEVSRENVCLFGIVCFQSACPLVRRFSIGDRLVCRAANNDINLIVRQSKSLCYSQEPSHHIHAIISSEGIVLSWAHAGPCVCLTTSIRKTIYQVLLKSNQYHLPCHMNKI